MRIIKATKHLSIEVPGPSEVYKPQVRIRRTDAKAQGVIVYDEEVRHLVTALSEASGVLAETWGR
jgi:hypothetical protein